MATRFAQGIDFDFGTADDGVSGMVAVPRTQVASRMFADLQKGINALLPLLWLPHNGADVMGPEHGILTTQTMKGMLVVAARVADPVSTVRDFTKGPSVLMLATYAPLLLDTVQRYVSAANTAALMAATAPSRGQMKYDYAEDRAKQPMYGYGMQANPLAVPGLQVPAKIDAASTNGSCMDCDRSARASALKGLDATAVATLRPTAPATTTPALRLMPAQPAASVAPTGPSTIQTAAALAPLSPITQAAPRPAMQVATTLAPASSVTQAAPRPAMQTATPIRPMTIQPATAIAPAPAVTQAAPRPTMQTATALAPASGPSTPLIPSDQIQTATPNNQITPSDPGAGMTSLFPSGGGGGGGGGGGAAAPADVEIPTSMIPAKRKFSPVLWGVAAGAAALVVGGVVMVATSKHGA